MMRTAVSIALLLAGTAGVGAATEYDHAFADAFGAACVPGRLSYDATREAALAAGWSVVERTDHTELETVMRLSDEAMGGEAGAGIDAETTLYAKDIADIRHHLAVTLVSTLIEEDDDPFVQVGCGLYNFDATGPVDPAPVTALLDTAIAYSIDRDGVFGHVWGPPCPMPRTFDTYLSYLSPGTPAALATGFSGVTLTFSTSSPAPDEEVPETYC